MLLTLLANIRHSVPNHCPVERNRKWESDRRASTCQLTVGEEATSKALDWTNSLSCTDGWILLLCDNDHWQYYYFVSNCLFSLNNALDMCMIYMYHVRHLYNCCSCILFFSWQTTRATQMFMEPLFTINSVNMLTGQFDVSVSSSSWKNFCDGTVWLRSWSTSVASLGEGGQWLQMCMPWVLKPTIH